MKNLTLKFFKKGFRMHAYKTGYEQCKFSFKAPKKRGKAGKNLSQR